MNHNIFNSLVSSEKLIDNYVQVDGLVIFSFICIMSLEIHLGFPNASSNSPQ